MMFALLVATAHQGKIANNGGMIHDRLSNRVCTSALLALLISLICISYVTAFTSPNTHYSSFTTSRAPRTYASSSSSLSAATSSNNNKKNVVVISPPGGIGEIASISAARLGGNVKWFVVSGKVTIICSSSNFRASKYTKKLQLVVC